MDEGLLLKRRNSLIVLIILLCFSSGWFCVVPVPSRLQLLISVATSAAVAMLLITISQLINRPILRSFHWLIYFFWPVLFPVYIIRFFKWKGLGIIILVSLLYILIMNAGYYVASLVCGNGPG